MSTKKTFRILAALMFAVCIIFALSSCDALVKKACEHKMVETAEKAATCEEAGNVKYFTCSECKKVYLDKEGKNETTLDKTVVAAKGHTEEDVAAVAPTCTATGLTAGKKCSVCDKVLAAQETVAALGHTEVVDAAVAATCTETGLTEGKHCSVCNEVLVAQDEVAALGHTAGAEATCTTAQTCTVCNEVLVAALGHTEVVDAAVAATCTATGLTEGKHCSVCNEVLVAQEEVAALGHTEGEAATCTTAQTCTVCNEVLVAALGHEFIDIVAKEPNCTEEGYTAHKACIRCPHTEGKEILPVKHVRVDGAGLAPTCVLPGYTDYWYCSKCYETFDLVNLEPLGHTLVDVAAKDATCFTDGYNAHQACSVCSHTVGKVIVPADHTGTWTADGNNEYILCTVCNKKYIREKNVVLDFADNKISAPAVLKPGTEGRLTVTVEDAVIKCIADKEAYDAETGNPEIYLTNTDADHSIATGGKYLVFEFDVKLGEGTNSTWPAFSIALMDNGGNTMHVIPVATYNNTVKLNGVALDNIAYVADKDNGTWMTLRYVVELATEKAADGNYVSYSTLYYKHRDIDEPMKKAGSTQTKKSTYTGNTGRTDAYRARIVQTGPNYPDQIFWLDNMTFFRTNDSNYLYSACAHELADWQTVSAPTCKADGVYTRKCTVEGCGYVETAYAPAGAHTPGEEVAAKAPTCGVAGHTAYNICPVCETKVGYEVVPATGHDLGDWAVDGDKQKRTCDNGCGYVEIRDNVTASPIVFDDGTVTGGDKLDFITDVVYGENNTTATSANGHATYSISTTIREGRKVLQVVHDPAKWVSGGASKFNVAAVGGFAEGATSQTYVLEFDTYVTRQGTSNSTIAAFQTAFGGYTETINTYGSNIRITGGGSVNVAPVDTWFTLKFVYVITADGSADYTIYYKTAGAAEYNTLVNKTVSNSGLKLAGVPTVTFIGYSGAKAATNYFDNISFTTYSGICTHVVESWTQTKAPACGADGEEAGTCKWCGATQTRAIDSIDHEYGEWVLVNLPACGVDGVETATCELCGDVKEQITPRLSEHALSAWADAEEGKESRSCGNEGCDYVQTRAKRNVITFDDGNLTDSDRLVYSANANVTAGATTATSNNDYATISIVAAPGRENDTALRVQTVVAKYNKSYAPTISVPTTDGSTTGNVYTLDFDLYNVTTYNGARAFLQLNFASAAITLNTYRDSVQLSNTYGEAQLGKCETWISVRFVFTVTADGSANYEVFKKGTDGEYVSVKTATLTNSSIKLDACTVSFFNYSAQVDRDYYLDNISLTRTAAAAE